MILEEMLKEQRAEGMAEGESLGNAKAIITLLNDLGTVPKELHEKILQEQDLDVLAGWLKKAAKAKSLEEFFGQIS